MFREVKHGESHYCDPAQYDRIRWSPWAMARPGLQPRSMTGGLTRMASLTPRPPVRRWRDDQPSRSSLRRRIYTRPRAEAEAEAEPRRREVGRGALEAKQQWGSPAVRPPFRWTSSGSPSAARSESDDKHLVAFLLPFRSKWGYFFFFSFSISGVALLFQLFRGVFSPLNVSSFRA